MGSEVVINDTLKLTSEQGMPRKPEVGKTYSFTLAGRRLYHSPPVRVLLVHEIEGKWKYVGHAHVLQQTIDSPSNTTSGRFTVVKIYDPDYARAATINESPFGKSFYD